MCGIVGWVDWDRDLQHQSHIIELMAHSLRHRGPDAYGQWISPRAAFGHRRLIVIDPVGGSQPMVLFRGGRRYVITYNGELYNTGELRSELEAVGCRFQSYSDTEVLLYGVMEWGSSCFARLNGIFAAAIWNESEQELMLVRDRSGIKPLFYAVRGTAFLFGSELKSILTHPLIDAEVNEQGLAEVLALGPARTPGCAVFNGIEELRPGRWLTHSRAKTQISRYWSLTPHQHEHDLDTTIDNVRQLVVDAVHRQLVADVPVGVLLSGGLDSSAVAAIAAREYDRRGDKLTTFSIDYRDNDKHFQASQYEPDADAVWVNTVSEYLDTIHRRVVLTSEDLLAALEYSLAASDLPGMVDIDASLLLFCRDIKQQVTVALSGEAADELFGGYPWYRPGWELQPDAFPWARDPGAREALLSQEAVARLKPAEYVAGRYQQALAEVPTADWEDEQDTRWRQLTYLNLTRFLPVLLDRKDRMSMAVGLEVRVPFCDHRLVDYVWNIPAGLRQCDGRQKGLLRRAVNCLLPSAVVNRPKSPYPKTHDPLYAQLVTGALAEVLADRNAPLLPLINVERVGQLLSGEHEAPVWFGQLMAGPQLAAYLLQVNHWLERYEVRIRC